MSAAECLFCKMIAGQIPVTKIYENDDILAFLDIGPISDGHTLIIPKQHFEKLDECPPELLVKVASNLGKISKAVSTAMNSEDYNILCNNGESAGQIIKHVHFHIIPRRKSDDVFNRWPSYKYPDGKIEEIAAQIREKI